MHKQYEKRSRVVASINIGISNNLVVGERLVKLAGIENAISFC